VALDQGYIEKSVFERIYEQADKVARMCSGFIKYLSSQPNKPNKPNKLKAFSTSELRVFQMRLRHLIYIAILLTFFLLCYHSTLAWMLNRWDGIDSYYSHGFLIPFISAYLIWRKKDELRGKPLGYSSFGLALILFAMVLHILGTVLYVFSLSGFSIFFFIIGAVLFICGKEITRTILFPLILLIFMFPLPLAFLSSITFPLKMLVAKAGVAIVDQLGVPVLRNGFDIIIPGGNLVVGNPCSGLRSLIAFLALGAVLSYLTNISPLKKLIIFLSSIPVAILSNAIRVPMLILISHFYGLDAASPESVWHNITGMLVFVLGLVLLVGVSSLLQWKS